MLLDLDFTSSRGQLTIRRAAVDGPGECSIATGTENLCRPVRLNFSHGFLVVTVASIADADRTARWIGTRLLGNTWYPLPVRWDHTGEHWSCAVRISPP